MNANIAAQVQRSFKELQPVADEVGVMFYQLLFRTHPELRAMFADDIAPQSRKLMKMLELMVNCLQRFDDVVPALQEFARRHKDYGVVDAHYAMVGEALIWTLAQVQGARFTCELEHAWYTAYEAISEVMIAATREPIIDQ